MSNKLQFHYEINLSSQEDGEFIDIQYCSFIRAPFYHTTSYCIIKCFVPQLIVQKYIEQTSVNNFPKFKMKIYLLDELGQFSSKRVDIIYQQTLQCISITPEKALKYTEDSIHIKMILVNPVLHYMGMTNVYNVILENTTGYGALKNFEGWIKNNYGEIFDFQHFGVIENQNTYQYEQILVKVPNDLNVPNYLIDSYKINNNPCFYFFDNFNIGEKTKNDIVCLYLNLSKLDSQYGQKTSLYPDTNMLTKIVKKIPIKDAFKKYDKDGHVFVFRSNEIKFDHKKLTTSSIPNKKSEMSEIELEDKRKIFVSNDGPITNQQISQSSAFSSIYFPDDLSNAKKRFESTKDQFINKLQNIVFIEITSAMPNYPIFGTKYDIEKNGKFDYTPLCICNIFVRKNDKEHFMILINKTIMLQFKTE